MAAAKLAGALAMDRKNFVRGPPAWVGDFFDRSGLLFGSLGDVRDTTAKLIDAQPLLGPLAYDPSLRGVAKSLATAAWGLADDPKDAAADRLEEPLQKLHASTSATLAGKPAWFSWQQMFASSNGRSSPAIAPGPAGPSRARFRQSQAGRTRGNRDPPPRGCPGLDAAHGVRIGVTGEVPLADEEFGSIEDGMGLIGLLMAAVDAAGAVVRHEVLEDRHGDRGDDPGGAGHHPCLRAGGLWPAQRDLDRLHPAVRRSGRRFRHPGERALQCRALGRGWHRRGARARCGRDRDADPAGGRRDLPGARRVPADRLCRALPSWG